MNTPTLIIIAIALAAIALAAAAYAMRRRRSDGLRERFGPEYDRALEGHGNRRAAENELAAREHRVHGLHLRPLSENERQGFARSWAALQRRFVDDPTGAVGQAHVLLEEVMNRRGYPTKSFDEEVELVSVEHPAAVQHYRAAHELHHDRQGGRGGTEENRQAMIHYRALFEELLEAPTAAEDARDEIRRRSGMGAENRL
ncbi:MAG TPA: hypothetical protein VKB80_10800 [Kofleriaceae bacterium]|nr:hypothetical protein [Kofleriaceae bacterium]